MPITGRTRLAGLVGWPVSGSRSPLIHNEWLRRAEIDGAYVPLPVRPGEVVAALHGLRAAGFAGVNVTLPHKEAAFAACDRLSAAARRAGSVNTICFGEDGAICGDSTDGQGFVASLLEAGVDPSAGPALVLGAGGAARAVVAALLDRGVPVTLANRGRPRAEALAARLGGAVSVVDWADRAACVGGHALLVNATTIGMADDQASPCGLERADAGLAVADIVYVPRVTMLLAEARARGLRAVEGLGMLLHQAGIGFAGWFGAMPVVDDALRALVQADLDRQG